MPCFFTPHVSTFSSVHAASTKSPDGEPDLREGEVGRLVYIFLFSELKTFYVLFYASLRPRVI